MRNITTLLAFLITLSSFTTMSKAVEFYQKTGVGYNKTSDYSHPDNRISSSFSPSFEIGLGVKLKDRSSIELLFHRMNHNFKGALPDSKKSYVIKEEFGTSNVDVDTYMGLSNKITTNAVIANFKYDILNSAENKIVPFGSIGLGLAVNKSNDFIYDIHKERYINDPTGKTNKIIYPGDVNYSIAWQVGAGFRIICDEKIDLEISGRYYDYGKSTSMTGAYYNKSCSDTATDCTDKITNTADEIGTKIRGFGGTIGLIWKF